MARAQPLKEHGRCSSWVGSMAHKQFTRKDFVKRLAFILKWSKFPWSQSD